METSTSTQAADRNEGDSPSLDALGFGVYRIDDEGLCTYVNPAALNMLGFDASEVIGRNMHELIHHSHPDGSHFPRSACPLLAARQTHRPVRLSNEVLWRKDGSFFVADYSAWPLLRDGRVAESVITILDSPQQAGTRNRLALQVTVSRMLAGTASLDDTLPRLIATIGVGLGCHVGFLWDLSNREKRLKVGASWAAPGIDAAALIEQTLALSLGRGEDLPGRAWEADELVYAADLATDTDEGRGKEALAATLVFAMAIPVRIGRRVLAVIELFSREPLNLDDDLIDSAAALGQQIGQYLRRKRAEEALRDREEEFRALAEGIPQMTWTADADGSITWFNKRWYEYTGTALEQAQGWGWLDAYHPDHLVRAESSYREAIKAGTVWEGTFPLRGRDGRHRWFLSRAVPIASEDGSIERWFGTNTDITEQRRAEARAVAAERRLRFALHVARIGSWSWDLDDDTLEADEGLRAIFHLPGDGPVPVREFFERIHPDDAPGVSGSFGKARRRRGEFDIEFRIVTTGEEIRWVVARGSVEQRPLSRTLYALGIAWDVSDRKRHEQDLATARDAAEMANLAKSQFIANMSHELRTPLSAILGSAELLVEEAEDLGEAGEPIGVDLGKIEASARHLLSLINGVLDMSKIEAGRMEVDIEAFEVAPVVQEVCDTVQGLMGKKGNAFEVDVADNLGVMRSDVVKLRQCLFNLLSNAAKFTEGGCVTLTVRRAGGRLMFRVADTGIGMTLEQQSRLFQRFIQADVSTTRRFGGTGLGLALTKAFAEMLGGDVAVDSVEGVGSTFTLTLPDDAQEPSPDVVEASAEEATDVAELVLVIDDDPHMRELLTRFLGRSGLMVVAAPDGVSGLDAARELRPSAILLDVMMPRMDGWAVLSALKAEPDLADIPVIMISMIRDKGLAYSLGAADYLTKPVDWQRLRDAVERHRNASSSDLAPGLALVVEGEAATREELGRLLAGQGWEVDDAADAVTAQQRMAERRPELVLVNLDLPGGGGFALLRELQRDPAWRSIPVIALTEGTLPLEERGLVRDQITQLVSTGEDGANELLVEIRRIAAERSRSRPSGTTEGTPHG